MIPGRESEPPNRFAPPEAERIRPEVAPGVVVRGAFESELVRRAHLGAEATVRAFGLLGYLLAALAGLAGGYFLMVGLGYDPIRGRPGPAMIAPGVLFLVVALMTGLVARGLRRYRRTPLLLAIAGLVVAATLPPMIALADPFRPPGPLAFGLAAAAALIPLVAVRPLGSGRSFAACSPSLAEVRRRTPGLRPSGRRAVALGFLGAAGYLVLLVLLARR